jgi:hypothetical protein
VNCPGSRATSAMLATTSHAGPGSMVHLVRFIQANKQTDQANRRAVLLMLANGFITRLVVQDDTKERAVHMDATIILQESQLPELIHEEAHP